MPNPQKGEKHDDYIKRCIPIVINDGTAKNPNQAVAICNSIWDKSKKKSSLELGTMRKIEFCNSSGPVEIAASADGQKKFIVGYASKFGTPSILLCGAMQWVIDPAAFDDIIDVCDCRALINHDKNRILGRTVAKTLRLSKDTVGLKYEIDPSNLSYCQDLMISLARGDINQSSFQFVADVDQWDKTDDVIIRTIKHVSELLDVSPVTYPKFEDTFSGIVEFNSMPVGIKIEFDQIMTKRIEEFQDKKGTKAIEAELIELELKRKRLNYL